MKPVQRVVWSEGMLMSPHHLQQQDLYHETSLHQRVSALSPYSWGVRRLELDARSLERNELIIEALEAVLPRGTQLSAGDGATELPARPFGSELQPGMERLRVYVGLPREREGVAAMSDDSNGARRFIRTRRRVLDANLGATPLDVEFAVHELRVLFETESLDDFECVAVAELVRDAQGAPCFSEAFVPACLRVGASAFVMAGLKRLLTLATSRQRALREQQRHRENASVEFHASDVTRFIQLSALNQALPWLRHTCDTGDPSPLEAYQFLCRWYGHLCTFSPQGDPLALPGYQHTQLRDTFEPLFALLTALLRKSLAGRCVTIPLESREDGMHLGRLDDERLLGGGVRFHLSVESNLEESQVRHTLPRIAKAGSWSEVGQLVSTALPGVPLSFEPRPAKEVPLRRGLTYFVPDTTSACWAQVLSERTLAVHLPPPFDAARTRLEVLAVSAED